MTAGIEKWAAPAFVGLCLLIGGSAQWPWATAALRLLAIALLAVSIAKPRERELRFPLWLAGLAAALALLQLVQLPAPLWAPLPGHQPFAAGYELLELPVPALPLSLDPAATISAALALLVPAAVFAALSTREGSSQARTMAVVLVVTMAGALLGILQWQSGSQRLYPYTFSDWSTAPGFFANPNHMGLLLVASIPLAAGLASERWQAHRRRSKRLPALVALGAAALVAIAVIPLEESYAALVLLPPVALASALIPRWGQYERWRQGAGVALLALAAAALIAGVTFGDRLLATDNSSIVTRSDIWSRTARAASDFAPLGSGLGTFERVYPRYEDPAKVDATYVNHAHNDYLELALEGGLPALLLVGAFLWWWIRQSIRAWRSSAEPPAARAAAIAGTAILVHSLVDFPLRTPAIAAVFAVCVAIVASPPRMTGVSNDGDIRRTRHRTIR